MDVVVAALRDRGFSTGKSTLSHYEKGQAPDIGILYGLAQVYGVEFSHLCELVAAELAGGKLPSTATPPTVEAMEIARAYDAGSEVLRRLLADSVLLWRAAGKRGNDPGIAAQDADTRG